MSRIPAIDPSQTTGKTRETLTTVQRILGGTPNLFRVAAQAPSVLEGLVGLTLATARGTLEPAAREAIALAVAEANGCNYCLSAHSALGRGAGLSDRDLALARAGRSPDPKTEALLGFARTLVLERGRVGEAALTRLRQSGISDAEVLEVIANVALNILTNYFNIVVDTDIDFPIVRAGEGL